MLVEAILRAVVSLIGKMSRETDARSSAIHVTRKNLVDFEEPLLVRRLVLVVVKAR